MPSYKKKAPAADAAAEETGPVFFYGVYKPNGYLSQMFLSKFEHAGTTFVCNEQYFQAAKAALFGDTVQEAAIMRTDSPTKQKALGKKVKPFDSDAWYNEAYKVVVKATYLKFTKSEHAPEIQPQLLATGERLLVEASARDRIWGAGLFEQAAVKIPEANWPGKNLLGKALMEVRARLKKEQAVRSNNEKSLASAARRSLKRSAGLSVEDSESQKPSKKQFLVHAQESDEDSVMETDFEAMSDEDLVARLKRADIDPRNMLRGEMLMTMWNKNLEHYKKYKTRYALWADRYLIMELQKRHLVEAAVGTREEMLHALAKSDKKRKERGNE